MDLINLIKKSHMMAMEHCWWEEPKSIGELLALIHSEVSEALEEHRNGRRPDETYYSKKIHCGIDWGMGKPPGTPQLKNVSEIYLFDENPKGNLKPEGIPSELADVVIRVADMCGYYGIDLEKAIEEKMEYNEIRSRKHGGKKL
ncbi:MAG: hypothetical protein PF487_05805 [Bacteroidales bacterium]|jgi:NTP pyrophosphatase (non-canonical NTP hydrolase)|nr:hypothetical protein [Bacteroidales bacterium]